MAARQRFGVRVTRVKQTGLVDRHTVGNTCCGDYSFGSGVRVTFLTATAEELQ